MQKKYLYVWCMLYTFVYSAPEKFFEQRFLIMNMACMMPRSEEIFVISKISFDLFFSDRYMEKHYCYYLQINIPYPECICQDGFVVGKTNCSDGFDRLTGSPYNTAKNTYFVPVQAVSDSIKNDTYGFWKVNQGELTITLQKESIVRVPI